MDDDAIIDEARELGERGAGAYLQRFGRYPAEDDADDLDAGAWSAAWDQLVARGADGGLHDAAFEAWRAGFLGPS